MNAKLKILAVVTATSFISTAALAGTAGPTSSDNIPVSLTINDVVAVGDIDGITLGTYAPGTAPTNSDDICVTRLGNNTVSVTLTSANAAGGVFNLTDGTDTIAYDVTYGGTTAASGTALTTQTPTATGGAAVGACASDSGAGGVSVAATVPEANITSSFTGGGSGAFADTITVLVAPTP